MEKSHFSVILAALLLVTAANANGNTELFQAIQNDDLAFIRHNLSKTQPEARDNRGATPLMHAAAFGSIEAMKLLLDAGADVNAKNDFGATSLLWCARDGEKARL